MCSFFSVNQNRTGVIIPLDMETESIDDMFAGCRSETAALIDQLGEWQGQLSLAWATIEKRAKSPAHMHLTDDHTKVLYMYTYRNLRGFRESFGQMVKFLKQGYTTYGFKFHYLYFYLTDAIQRLRGNQTWCRTTYLHTNQQFSRGIIGAHIRLGTFTLTASNKTTKLSSGKVSCFEIYTCFGANISYYSAIDEEGQVLIPTYEVFKVTHILTRKQQQCAVVYKLQSTKIPRSDLNCKLRLRKPEPYLSNVLLWTNTLVSLGLLIIVSVALIKFRQGYFVSAVVGMLLIVLLIAEIFASQSIYDR